MGRRADPARLHAARRAGTRRRLELEGGLSPELAERWIAAWERVAEITSPAHDGAFWDLGWGWIAEQRSARKVPE